jgi:hypothetical protein
VWRRGIQRAVLRGLLPPLFRQGPSASRLNGPAETRFPGDPSREGVKNSDNETEATRSDGGDELDRVSAAPLGGFVARPATRVFARHPSSVGNRPGGEGSRP